MRHINTTIVNVHVNDRTDRTNVVVTHGKSLRRLCLFVRGVCQSLARPWAEWLKRRQAMQPACAMAYAGASLSLSGHCPSGGPGSALGS